MVPRETLVKRSSSEEMTFITAEVARLNTTAPEQSTDEPHPLPSSSLRKTALIYYFQAVFILLTPCEKC